MFGNLNSGKRDRRNLIAWYPFANDAKDYSGNKFHLTTNGTMLFTTVNGKQCAGPFSSSNYFSAPQSLMDALTAAQTAICMEVTFYSNDNTVTEWVFASNSGGDEWGLLLPALDQIIWRTNGPGQWAVAGNAQKTWINLTFDGSGTTTKRTFVNNILKAGSELIVTGTWKFTAATLFNIGKHSTGANPFNGYIKDLKFWSINQISNLPTQL